MIEGDLFIVWRDCLCIRVNIYTVSINQFGSVHFESSVGVQRGNEVWMILC